jgi:hypothetical protein
MHTTETPVSLADLSAAGIRLCPEEAVSIVRELALQVVRGELAGVPSAHVIRLSTTGRISVEGPVGAGGPSVVRAAQLLESLLPTSDAPAPTRVPGGLKLVLARGQRNLDLPPFASLEAFADALTRFAAADPAIVVGRLVERWTAAVATRPAAENGRGDTGAVGSQARVELFAPAESSPVRAALSVALTISDIRRARRATGISLGELAERSRISIGLLRQLEWGYLLNWPPDAQGRLLLTRYARAAGLDEQLVMATVTPLIDQVAALRTLFAARPAPQQNAEPRPGRFGLADIPLAGAAPAAEGRPATQPRRRTGAWAAAAAALLIAALLPAWWLVVHRPSEEPRAAQRGTQTDTSARVAQPERERRDAREALARSAPAGARQDAGPADPPAATSAARALEPETSLPRVPASGRVEEDAPPPAAAGGNGPAMTARDPQSWSPVPASVGTAMFHAPDAADTPAAVGASARGAGSVLRVTRIVGDSANNSHVQPSPDGRRIAFDSDRDGERGVYVADADGRNVRRVSPDGFAAIPSWSPDGRTLAFVRAEGGQPDVWNLWTLDLDTGVFERVTRHLEGQPRGASWFPSADRLVYSLDDRLVIHDLQSGKERVFPSPRRGQPIGTPVVSPDGRRVAFQLQRDGVWLLEVSNGSMRRVLDDPTADAYTWSPDGRQLAYHSARAGGWNIWMMAPR